MRTIITLPLRMILILVFITLAGCSVSTDSDVADDGTPYVEVRTEGFGMYVAEVILSDGTRCAVAQGYYKGGITCDWRD